MTELAKPALPILLTGAAGALGRVVAQELAGTGWQLRLTDRAPFPGEIPDGARFSLADLEDQDAIEALADGCGAIVHFGGISEEKPFEEVCGPNILGTYHIYEAARRNRARVVFASSHHVAGFYRRGTVVTEASPMRPDGYYALSKAYGELMARMYWDKHGVESVCVRIGVSRPQPTEDRMLATWLSHPDLVRLIERSVLAKSVGCLPIWGVSNNRRMTWWQDEARDIIGWHPRDDAENFLADALGKTSGDPVAERYQGSRFCSVDYSRTVPAPD